MKMSLLLVLGLMVTLAAQAQVTVDHIYHLEWVDSLTSVQAPQYQFSLDLSSQEWANGFDYSTTTQLAYPNSLVVYSPHSWMGPGATFYEGPAITYMSWDPVGSGGNFYLNAIQEDDMHLAVYGFNVQPSGINQWVMTAGITEHIHDPPDESYYMSGIFQITMSEVPEPHFGAVIAGMTTLFLILQKIRKRVS